MESQSLLSIEDQLAGYVEPDLDSFVMQGVDAVWVNVQSDFVLSASPKERLKFQSPFLGGRWGVRIAYGTEGSPVSVVNVERVSQDSAIFSYKFLLEGVYKIYIDVSSIPVTGSPFSVTAKWGSENQLNKWSGIHTFLNQDCKTTTYASIRATASLLTEAIAEQKIEALDYRRHLLESIEKVDKIDETRKYIQDAGGCIVLRKQGSVIEDTYGLDAILVCHNSWMEWPKESGYQAKILGRLQEKERNLLLEKSTTFGKNKLNYGSTMIFPVSNLALPDKKVNPKQLINTVTVVFKSRDKLASQPYKHTKMEDLKKALDLALREADRKGIKSIGIPHTISQNYYSGGKNDEAVFTVVKELASTKTYTSLKTLVIITKSQTPKTNRKKVTSSGLLGALKGKK